MAKIAVLFANGFEEIEAVTVVDVLRRACVETDMIGVESLKAKGAHGINIDMDKLLDEVNSDDYDGVVLPGGLPGSYTLRDSQKVQGFIKAFKGKVQAAVCAAPIALKAAGILDSRHVTSHPSVKDEFDQEFYVESEVVVDGKIITSRGAGTSFEFSAAILTALDMDEEADKWRGAMIYPELR